MKIEFLKTKQKWKKGGFHTNPNIGWGLVLLVSTALCIWALAFGAILFRRTQQEHVADEGGNGSQIRIVKKARVEKALEYFTKKEEVSKEIREAPTAVIDPSL